MIEHPYRLPAVARIAPGAALCTPRGPRDPHVAAALVALALCLAVLLAPFAALLSGCSATPHQIATNTVVTVGDVAQTFSRANERVYRDASDALRARLSAEHATIAEFNRQTEPLDAAFSKRALALSALSAQLYAAAAIIDAARSGASPAQYAEAARLTVIAIDQLLTAIEDGAVLPPLPLPPQLDVIRATLRGLAGEVS